MTVSDQAARSSELSDVTVLEIGGRLSSAFAARILGDFGAHIVMVEPPDGHALRTAAGPDAGLFPYLNWGKDSVVADLTDRARIGDLASDADVIISGLPPQEARELGLTAAELRAHHPRAVIVSVTDFGADGPYADLAASELVLQATGGVMAISGTAADTPLRRGLRQSLFYGGINAAYAAIAGVYALRTSGDGVLVDLSLRECVSAELVMNQSMYAFLGVLQSRPPAVADPFGGYPLPCADGFVTVQASTAAPMSRLAELFGEPSLTEQAFASKEGRTVHAGDLRALVAPVLATVGAHDFFVDAARRGYVAGFVQTATDMLACEQLASRRAFHSFPDVHAADGTPLRFPAALGRLSGWDGKEPVAAAPAPGERRPHAPTGGSPTGGGCTKPFSALRVLDLSQVFAGPYVGGLLADFGADVVKIESPHRLDQARTDYGGYFDNVTGADPWNRTSTFQVLNRGKKAISLDLKSERGMQIFRDLVAGADIVLENFTPRVMPGLGLGYPALKELNPGLIMLSNSGFGATGPWSGFKAQGTTLEATMGVCTFTGYDGGPPSKAGQSYPDFVATWTGLTALMAALVGRLRTGRGQHIDLGMYELGLTVMPEAVLAPQLHGAEVPRTGNRDLGALAGGVVACAGVERWLAWSAHTPEQERALRSVVGGSDEVGTAVAGWARHRDVLAAAAELQAAGVPAGPVQNARDLLLDPQLQHRGFYEAVDVPAAGTRPIVGRPFTWSGGGVRVHARGRAPRFAEHTTEIVGGRAGVAPEQLAADIESGAVALVPVRPLPATPNDFAAMLANGSVLEAGDGYKKVVAEAVRLARPAAPPVRSTR